MTALLALHIESALDPAGTELIRSLHRISISQIMLVLTEGKEIPAIKAALPIFKEILAKNNLCTIPLTGVSEASALPQPQDWQASSPASPHTLSNSIFPHSLQHEGNMPLFGDVFGLDFLNDWNYEGDISHVDFDSGKPQE